MIFARANSYTEIRSAAIPTSAGLSSLVGMAQRPAQGCACYTGIARAAWDLLLGEAVYK